MTLMEAYRLSRDSDDDLVSVLYYGVHYILNQQPAKLMGNNVIPLMFVTPDGKTPLPNYAYRDDQFYPGGFNFNY